MPDIDWSALAKLAEDEKFEVLPIGTYAFVCEKAEVKNTAAGNGINVSMMCKVMEGPMAGRKTFGNVYIPSPNADVKPGAYGMMAAKLNAIGVPLATLAQHNASPAQAATLFVGRTFLGTVGHREWPKGSGNMRDGIDTIAPLPTGGAGGAGAAGGGFVPGVSQAPASADAPSGAPAAPW